jgi:hypothetical protein
MYACMCVCMYMKLLGVHNSTANIKIIEQYNFGRVSYRPALYIYMYYIVHISLGADINHLKNWTS